MTVPQIHHVILTVSSLERARAFYGDLLGFELTALDPAYGKLMYFPVEGGRSVWLIQHDQTPPDDRFSEFRLGLDHLAFTAPSKAFLDELAAKLLAAGVNTKGVELFYGQYYYVAFRDPDNIQLEYWLDTPQDAPDQS